MAKKYVNYRVGGTPEKKDENYTVWSNDLLTKFIAIAVQLTDEPIIIALSPHCIPT